MISIVDHQLSLLFQLPLLPSLPNLIHHSHLEQWHRTRARPTTQTYACICIQAGAHTTHRQTYTHPSHTSAHKPHVCIHDSHGSHLSPIRKHIMPTEYPKGRSDGSSASAWRWKSAKSYNWVAKGTWRWILLALGVKQTSVLVALLMQSFWPDRPPRIQCVHIS